MATSTATRPRPRAPIPARVPCRVRRPTRPRQTREQRLADAREREVIARRRLALALVRAEQTYALAVRNLEEFEAYLDAARPRLAA